jgi:hypothetical protein
VTSQTSAKLLALLAIGQPSGAGAGTGQLVALRSDGDVDVVDVASKQVASVVATGADPQGGITEAPTQAVVYVTARGHDDRPAVWSIALAGTRQLSEVVPDAELPSLSPDGSYLGYVTLDGAGRQDGVAIVALDRAGRPVGTPKRFASTTVPPPLPITGIAVGRRDAELAVWGGFVDTYLGRHQPTVGTLVAATSSSLAQLAPIIDGEGVSGGPPTPGQTFHPIKWWCRAPVYEPDGYLLVGDARGGVDIPWSQDSGGINGGGIRYLLRQTGSPLVSLAFGPQSSLAFVTVSGELWLAPDGAYLPFGPGAETDPTSGPPPSRLGTGFAAVAWTPGPSAVTTPLPRQYVFVAHLRNLVGMSEAHAVQLLDALLLPSMIDVVPRNAPKGTVTGQNPAAGDGTCQCTVILHVSSGPG